MKVCNYPLSAVWIVSLRSAQTLQSPSDAVRPTVTHNMASESPQTGQLLSLHVGSTAPLGTSVTVNCVPTVGSLLPFAVACWRKSVITNHTIYETFRNICDCCCSCCCCVSCWMVFEDFHKPCPRLWWRHRQSRKPTRTVLAAVLMAPSAHWNHKHCSGSLHGSVCTLKS